METSQPNNTQSPEIGTVSALDFIEDRQFDFATGRAVELITKAHGRTKQKKLLMLEDALWHIRQRVFRPEKLRCTKGTILVWQYCETKRLTPILSTAISYICQTFIATGDLHLTQTMLQSAHDEIKKEIQGIQKYL